jgi:endonuclease G, mitochondrial
VKRPDAKTGPPVRPGPGYDGVFLGAPLPLPSIDSSLLAPLAVKQGFEIRYTHYSAFVHAARRLPIMTAVNIRGAEFNAPGRQGNEPWKHTTQIAEKYQIDNRFYGNDDNTFDRGHLVRRVDPCWGSDATARRAEQETFRWINCTPQHKKLNREGGIWYQLEQHVMEHGVENKIADVAVFAGPVLAAGDLPFVKKYLGRDVPIPLVFWKVIVWRKRDGSLNAVGFMMSQWEWVKDKLVGAAAAARRKRLADDYFENLMFSDHKTYQVPVQAIVEATGIRFEWPGVKFPYKARAYKAISATRGERPTFPRPTKRPRGVHPAHKRRLRLKGIVL